MVSGNSRAVAAAFARDGAVLGVYQPFVAGDVFNGGVANDTFVGLDGADTLNGGGGDDFLIGRQGNDSIDGGSGFDTVGFTGEDFDPRAIAFSGVTVDLAAGTATDEYGTTDTIVLGTIENVHGTIQDDSITGDAAANLLDGRGGDDTFTGGGGDDTFIGGDGSDTAIYAGDLGNFTIIDQGGGIFTIEDMVGNEGLDTLTDVENAIFNGFNVELIAPCVALAETTTQSAVTPSADTSSAGAADEGGGGDDTFIGGGGDDTFIGGDGSDTAIYAGDLGNFTIIDQGGGIFTIEDMVGNEGLDTLTDVENAIFNGFNVELIAPCVALAETTTQSAVTPSADTSSAGASESLGEAYSITSADDGGALGAVESAGV